MPLGQITHQILAKVSMTTIQCVLAAQGYYRRVAHRVPFLTAYHKRLRLSGGGLTGLGRKPNGAG
jgi:hypothetical protein